MKIKLFTIPNLLTLLNLFCGSLAAVAVLRYGDLRWAFYLILAAAVFDFLDGFAARLLKSYSEVGKELDSLADVVSFGLVPGAILYTMYGQAAGADYWGVLGFVLTAFSALRLAKFNIDENQTDQFIGLPTPASALFVAAAGYLMQTGVYLPNPFYVIGVGLVLSYFLVCNTAMFALKFKHYALRGNELRYGFVVFALAGVVLWGVLAIPFVILAYICLSVVSGAVCKKCK